MDTFETRSRAPVAGINLPVLMGAYNHDLAPNERYAHWGCAFRPLTAFRYLAMCRNLGFGAVRIWLCENGEGIRFDTKGRPLGVLPELLSAVEAIEQGAQVAGLRIYWTLLDANAWQRNGDSLVADVARDAGEAERFADIVAAPIAERLDPATTFALEVLNEPESISHEVVPDQGLDWESIVRAIRIIRGRVHQALAGVRVTAGSQAVFLPGLLADKVAGGEPPVDAVDIHVYHPTGGLPPRTDLPVDVSDMDLWAGECGLNDRGPAGDSEYLVNYLYNARKLGYEAAFLWKLEGKEHLLERRGRKDDDLEAFHITRVGELVQDLLWGSWSQE